MFTLRPPGEQPGEHKLIEYQDRLIGARCEVNTTPPKPLTAYERP
ncbi:hypothetical protein [Streptomyces sp. NRRL S-118]|nr:hypothetical protein [Streptomyces sp. NRRL S-118]